MSSSANGARLDCLAEGWRRGWHPERVKAKMSHFLTARKIYDGYKFALRLYAVFSTHDVARVSQGRLAGGRRPTPHARCVPKSISLAWRQAQQYVGIFVGNLLAILRGHWQVVEESHGRNVVAERVVNRKQ